MGTNIQLHDGTYLSSKEAGSLFGYTHDYVSRLCREGQVDGKKIGRSWYVKESSLRTFFEVAKEEKQKRYQKLSSERKEAYASVDELIDQEPVPVSTHLVNLLNDEVPAERAAVEQEMQEPIVVSNSQSWFVLPSVTKYAIPVAGLVMTVGVLVTAQVLLSDRSVEGGQQASVGDVVADGAGNIQRALKHVAFSVFSFFWSEDEFNTSSIAREMTPPSEPIPLNTEPRAAAPSVTVPVVEPQPTNVEPRMEDTKMIVVEKDTDVDMHQRAEEIASTFSDDVEVSMIDEKSGYVRTTFIDAENEEYLFVLVPHEASL